MPTAKARIFQIALSAIAAVATFWPLLSEAGLPERNYNEMLLREGGR